MKCHEKVRFTTPEAAEDSAALINGGNRSNRNHKPLRAYQCECGQWHLTSKPERRKQRAA